MVVLNMNSLVYLGRVRLGNSGIRIYSGIYSGYSAPGSRIAGMEIQVFGIRIAPKQTLTRIIPIILIPD